MKESEKLLLRVNEAAELASVSRTTAYTLVASGEWPSITIGRSRRVPAHALRAWITKREQEGLEAAGGPIDA
jgi:excisionase family DNA binding protein